MILFYCILVLIILYAYFWYTIKHLVVIDKMFPGPMTIPFLGNALIMFQSSQGIFETIREMCIFYRRSFRMWIGNRVFIVTFEPKDAEIILGSTTQINKAENYEFLLPWVGDGLLVSTGQKWKKHRKILTPAFHFKILERFVQTFEDNGNILCDKLSEHMDGDVFDAQQLIKLYALDNICETAMGTQIHAQKRPNSAYVRSIKEMCTVAFRRSLTAWLRPDWIFNMTKYGDIQRRALKIIHETTISVIQKRKIEIKELPDDSNENKDFNIKRKMAFLDILLKGAEENGMTDKEIQEEVDTFMFEGHDTITSALSFAVYSLAANAQYQDKAFQEQLSIFGDDDRPATYKDLQDMKYLEQIIKETLRLYPSVSAIARLITEDTILDPACFIPKGAQVLLAIAGIHRNPLHYERPLEFYPDHFTPEATQKRNPYSFIPFSAGQRNCIGQRFAMLEMKSCLSKILRKFELIHSSKIEDEPVLASELILISENGIRIKIGARKYAESQCSFTSSAATSNSDNLQL